MRRMPAVTLAVVVWVALGAEPAWSAPCPEPDRDPVLPGYVTIGSGALAFPERLAYGREGAVKVSFTFTPNDASWHVEKGHLEYVDASGRLLFDHALTPAELSPHRESSFPLRVTPAGSVLVRLSFREYAPWYEPYCDFTVEETVRAVPGVAPRLVGENGERGWRGYADDMIFLVRPTECERIAPGRLRVVVRHDGRKRVLVAQGSCAGGSWRQEGQPMPGLRLGSGGWDYLAFKTVGRRAWTRTYRVDVSWNGRRIARRWLRLAYRVYPAHRIYANQDEESFYHTCEGGSDDTGHEGLPIRVDPERGEYCVAPGSSWTEGRILTRRPG